MTDTITLNRINFLHPAVRQEISELCEYINKNVLGKGVRLRFTHTLRTFSEQTELYAHGRSKLYDRKGLPLGIVTNAKAGQSIHNYGLAFDIVILIDKNNDGVFESVSWNNKADNDNDGIADWTEVANFFKKNGWNWGGDWKSFPDYPHFEKTFGLSWRELQTKYNAQDTFTERIENEIYKWVNL